MLLWGIVGGELGMFFTGVFFLIKGEMKFSKTKTVRGPLIRLGALACALPMPLIIVIAVLTGSPQSGILLNAVTLLASLTGIVLSVIGLVIGLIVLYSAPGSPSSIVKG